jgi:hypothetical protein
VPRKTQTRKKFIINELRVSSILAPPANPSQNRIRVLNLRRTAFGEWAMGRMGETACGRVGVRPNATKWHNRIAQGFSPGLGSKKRLALKGRQKGLFARGVSYLAPSPPPLTSHQLPLTLRGAPALSLSKGYACLYRACRDAQGRPPLITSHTIIRSQSPPYTKLRTISAA